MSDKPIRFSGPMVRAILEGRKTQTRRVLKPQPTTGEFQGVLTDTNEALFGHTDITRHCQAIRIPYAPGDRLWVREAWRASPVYDDLKPSDLGGEESIFYEADGTWESWGWGDTSCVSGGRNRQSMFMPRWASRLTLAATDVRVQRLQEISSFDCLQEGIRADATILREISASHSVKHRRDEYHRAHVEPFRALWDSLNAKPKPVGGKITTHYVSYPWDGEPRTETYRGKPHHIHPNPWVSATTFTAHRCNIDQMEAR